MKDANTLQLIQLSAQTAIHNYAYTECCNTNLTLKNI